MSLLHYEQTSPKTLDRPKRALVGVKGIRVLALETSKDAQATEILKLKTRIKKLEKKCKPSISHHKAWLRSVSILSMKKKLGKKEYVSKQGRKNAKPRPTLDDSAFDNLDADGIDYMDTKEVVNKGRESKETEELNVTHDTGVLKKGGSNEEQVNAAGNIGVSTVVPEVSTVNISTASRPEVSTATLMTLPTTTSVFDNEDITLAETLVKMKDDKAKLKGVAIKEVKESDRPERSVLTLKPLPKIDPKDKGKGVLEEEHEPAKKLNKSDLDAAQLAMDKEFAIQANAELQAELERERVAAEEATQAVLASEFDEIQARINADTLLAKRLQEAEREQFTVEQRAKFLHDIIAAQRKFLAEQRAVAIRNKPLTKTQLRHELSPIQSQHGDSDDVLNILNSIDEGPFKMGKFIETLAEGALYLGPERDRVFVDLTPEKKERFKADIRATNILLHGLPKDIYTLINHYTNANYIWDNVKMLLEGSELTKDERESQLYDDFEQFR
ncbi:hypothetical protein Tco_0773021 [Tanacetum coccineum]|uniref:Integrase, catalytic region, zinc finger, CCHC-type, peptidase aspartic, catalytic n=1 Tax=Tanacetum coccineum TaxID=301880 RepID=A0ABQ4ZN19_9ASTR